MPRPRSVCVTPESRHAVQPSDCRVEGARCDVRTALQLRVVADTVSDGAARGDRVVRRGRWAPVFSFAIAALLVLSGASATGAAPLSMPATIRVILSVDGPLLRIDPADRAALEIEGQPFEAARSEGLITVGAGLRYLALPAQRVPDEARGLAITGPAAAAAPGVLLVGPYGPGESDQRHRRMLHAALGVAPRVTAPRSVLQVGSWATGALPHNVRVVPPDLHAISRVNGRPYRGALEARFEEDRWWVVNEVSFGDYLTSVVGAEMPASWELEALKAQAVAARNYALHHLRPEASFDICDDQRCQAYSGVASEYERTRMAVEATAGVVAVFDGKLIEALYSANAGDYTESAENVWGAPVPYLQAVPSPGDAEALGISWGAEGYRWTREIPLTALRDYQTFKRAGIGDIIDLQVVERAASGRPLRLEVVGDCGRLELTGDEIRIAFGLPSAFVDVSIRPPHLLELINPTARRRGALLDQGYHILATRRSVAFDTAPSDVRLYNGAVWVIQFVVPTRAVFSGRGYGHGVGMSQWGAQGMARAGHTYDEILRHYYPGIQLENLDQASPSSP